MLIYLSNCFPFLLSTKKVWSENALLSCLLSCWHLATGHACLRAIVLCGLYGLGDWGVGLAWECAFDVEWM